MDGPLAAVSIPAAAFALSCVGSGCCSSAALAAAGAAAAGALAASRRHIAPRAFGAAVLTGAVCVGRAVLQASSLPVTLGVATASAASSFAFSRWLLSWHGLGIGLAEQLVLVQALVTAIISGLEPVRLRLLEGAHGRGSAGTVVALLCAGAAVAALIFLPLIRNQQWQPGQAGSLSQRSLLALAAASLAATYAALYLILPEEPITWVTLLIFSNARWFVWLLVCTAGAVGAAQVLKWFVAAEHKQGSAEKPRDGWTVPRRQLVARKAFHVVALLLFAPPIVLGGSGGLAFMQVASAGALLVCVLLELVRASSARGAPLRAAIDALVAPLVDERDSGPLIMTHLYLIAGCGLPLWLTSAAQADADAARMGPWASLLPLAGVLAAVGDGAAATVGVAATAMGQGRPWLPPLRGTGLSAARASQAVDEQSRPVGGAGAAPEAAQRDSRPPTHSSAASVAEATLSCSFSTQLLVLGADAPALQRTLERKTVQGSIGFAVAAAFLSWLIAAVGSYFFQPHSVSSAAYSDRGLLQAGSAAAATALVAVVASALETCTVGVDNLVMPLAYWLLLRVVL